MKYSKKYAMNLHMMPHPIKIKIFVRMSSLIPSSFSGSIAPGLKFNVSNSFRAAA